MTEPGPEPLETAYVRIAVTAWEAMAVDGLPEDNVERLLWERAP